VKKLFLVFFICSFFLFTGCKREQKIEEQNQETSIPKEKVDVI